ncbi:Zinc finger CCCH domain-containing protein 3 [Pleurostoma richardsiae]|uniref:Zinc finger CCCH domain-containing protein 3 n=1 Tax=Pleurostoma richardsiae TaxID=41990 RepID=A0AA38VNV3_9PEZI|nr:Zinc finger CCCH domain-containing protein 3 [Pleurostoma richardsiae]
MSAEDRELLAQISQLAGQINRHKSQQSGVSAPTPNHYAAPYPTGYPARGGYRGRGSHSARGGYRVAKVPAHRNRSLVLNGSLSSHKSDADADPTTSYASNASWVTKSDRHLQLINSAVYEKEAQARTKAIEQTRLQKQRHKDHQERAKLFRHLSGMGGGAQAVPADNHAAANYEIIVDNIPFRVTKNGSKLVKLPGDRNSPKATPKVTTIGGVKFYRSKNGNLYRHGIVKAQRRSGAIRKVNVPCQRFSTTGTCAKGPACRYVHDPAKVAACKDFLQKGECPNGDECDLSHDLIPERTPTCVHYLKGTCSNPNCRYTHVKLLPSAPVCRSFGLYGYCEKGASCADRHSYECPDFSNTGTCKNKRCKLLHRERASVLRKATAARNGAAEDDEDDLSSDDDGDSVNSDDVDSDEVEEFIGEDDSLALDFANQKDFIQL